MTPREKVIFWRKHVEAQEQSALSQIAYSKQHNIVCSRLVYWRIRFKKDLAKKRKEPAPNSNFIRLGISTSKPEVVILALTDGNRIEIPGALTLTLLPDLLSVLKPTT